ncbi:MAG: hypothetical protein JXB13_10100 [Phycisphaerae bacterium]|nr:hypothetical protein [Phycisphaerae bacterium]
MLRPVGGAWYAAYHVRDGARAGILAEMVVHCPESWNSPCAAPVPLHADCTPSRIDDVPLFPSRMTVCATVPLLQRAGTLPRMEYLRIIGLCVVSAVAYGIVHDQVTARLCVEYFTIGHPRILASESPTVLAITWGVIATWWAGLVIGVPLALAACIGGRHRMTARSLIRPVAGLLILMGVLAFVGGIVGYVLGARGDVRLAGHLASRVPQEKQAAFLAALWAHSASYLSGFVGGLVLVVTTIIRRARARTPISAVARDAPPSAQ